MKKPARAQVRGTRRSCRTSSSECHKKLQVLELESCRQRNQSVGFIIFVASVTLQLLEEFYWEKYQDPPNLFFII